MYNSEKLLSSDLDVEAYLRYALHSSSLTAEQSRLTSCLAQVKEDMQGILADHADGMIRQLQATHTAQRDVGAARQSVDSLVRATDRLRLMIEDPYNTIQGKLTELENTNEIVDVLRDVLKFISLSSRLQEVMTKTEGGGADGGATASAGVSAGDVDITRAARTLKELEDLCAVADIRGIEVVEARMSIVEKLSTVIRHRMHELLSVSRLLEGIGAGGSVAPPPGLNRVVLDMGTALQCAYTLGDLTKVVHGFMMERKREALKAIVRELDSQAIAEQARSASAAAPSSSGGGLVGGIVGGTGANEVLHRTESALLSRIQGALFTVVQQTQCAMLLWRVLLRRQDALTQVPISHALDSPVQLLLEYWNAVMDKLRERLVALQRRADFEAALTASFPRFRQLLDSLLSSSGELAGVAGVGAVVGPSGSGGGSAAAPLSGASGSSLVLLKVSQWGLGDFMDLVQAVDAGIPGSGGGGSVGRGGRGVGGHAPPSAASVETLKSTWLSLVADDLQRRFAALLMDRHRERMAPILSKLASITPATTAVGAQALSVSAADARRGALPAAACALDVSGYTRLALQDCYLYRQDPLALRVAVQCALSATQQLLGRLREVMSKHPLPPLPAVTTSVTRTQLLHVCIVNACTALVNDLAGILTLLPDAVRAAGGPGGDPTTTVAGGGGADPGAGSMAGQLGRAHQQLRDVLDAFRTISESSSQPFLSSARVTLLPAVTSCVEVASGGGGAADSRAILQLQTRLEVFLTNYFLLIDPRTSAWRDGARRLADALICRLLAHCVTLTPGAKAAPGVTTPALNRALAGCLQEALIVILAFATASQGAGSTAAPAIGAEEGGGGGGVGRSTLMLKGAAKQAELLYTTLSAPGTSGRAGRDEDRLVQEMHTILKPLYPLLARLLIVQQLQRPPPPSRPAALEGSSALTEVLEQGLMAFCESSPPTHAAQMDQDSLLSPQELSRRTAEATEAAEAYVRSLVEASPAAGGAGASSGSSSSGDALVQVWRLLS